MNITDYKSFYNILNSMDELCNEIAKEQKDEKLSPLIDKMNACTEQLKQAVEASKYDGAGNAVAERAKLQERRVNEVLSKKAKETSYDFKLNHDLHEAALAAITQFDNIIAQTKKPAPKPTNLRAPNKPNTPSAVVGKDNRGRVSRHLDASPPPKVNYREEIIRHEARPMPPPPLAPLPPPPPNTQIKGSTASQEIISKHQLTKKLTAEDLDKILEYVEKNKGDIFKGVAAGGAVPLKKKDTGLPRSIVVAKDSPDGYYDYYFGKAKEPVIYILLKGKELLPGFQGICHVSDEGSGDVKEKKPVFKYDPIDSAVVAGVKLLRQHRGKKEEELRNEYEFMKLFKGLPHVVQPDRVVEENGKVTQIFMVNYPGGTLRSITSSDPADPAKERCIGNIFEGLEAIHNKGVIHGDLEPNNIFLSADKQAFIGDLGSCMKIGNVTNMVGTQNYMAPELLQARLNSLRTGDKQAYKNLTEKVDAFSLGLILLELSGQTLWTKTPAAICNALEHVLLGDATALELVLLKGLQIISRENDQDQCKKDVKNFLEKTTVAEIFAGYKPKEPSAADQLLEIDPTKRQSVAEAYKIWKVSHKE